MTDQFALPEIPQPDGDQPNSMNYQLDISLLVSSMLKNADSDRYAIAADMSRLIGKEVTKNMLDAYSSGSREHHNIPFYLIPVLEKVCHSHELTLWLANKRGGKALFGREILDAELGKLEYMKEEISQGIYKLKKFMGEEE